MTACPFCGLSKREAGRILAHNDLAQVALSNPRLMPGHLLVIPKRHVTAIWELTPAELTAIFDYLSYFEQRLLEQFGTGCDIRQNYRPFLKDGQLKVSHLHFHIHPRVFEDQLYQRSQIHETPLFTPLTPTEQADIIRRLVAESN